MCIYLVSYFRVQKGRFCTQLLPHIYYTKMGFFQISSISAISGTLGCVELGGYPWVTSWERSSLVESRQLSVHNPVFGRTGILNGICNFRPYIYPTYRIIKSSNSLKKYNNINQNNNQNMCSVWGVT